MRRSVFPSNWFDDEVRRRRFRYRCKQRISDQIIEVEVIDGNDSVALCLLLVFLFETLSRREIVGNVLGCLKDKDGILYQLSKVIFAFVAGRDN